ncbi:DNA polymerase III [Rhodocyclus tenuis]|nr:uracil-DNA glycosylase [Rhodocyclus tenuis]MBK1679708.1 DNA polymerase III [Rhodocyclus tenuis]
MGLGPLWKLRGASNGAAAGAPAADAATQRASAPADTPATESARQLSAAPRGVSPMPAAEAVRATPAHSAPAASDPAVAGEWAALNRQIIDCRACTLCAQRQQAVPGVGDQSADWLFIGEGPGAEEDARGEPFVGAAGKLLDAMLAAIDLKRGEDVYIANAVKCRPPNNRTPEAAEIAACRPYLERQVALLRPRLIVLLGRAAVQATLGLDGSLASLRDRAHAWEVGGRSIPVIVTYHPAYLLRTPLDKARAWEDLCRARALMRAAKAAALDNASTAPN